MVLLRPKMPPSNSCLLSASFYCLQRNKVVKDRLLFLVWLLLDALGAPLRWHTQCIKQERQVAHGLWD